MRVAVISLSSCLGCQMMFLSLEEYLYTLIGENNVTYAPFLMDEKEMPEVDLAMVEGTVRNGDQFMKAREARERSSRLVALGTCACFGGVQGLANRVAEEVMLRHRYGEGAAFVDKPQGIKRLLPLDAFVRIDAYLPGCPPPVDLLESFLELVLAGNMPSRDSATVCSECRLSSPSITQPGPRRITEAVSDDGKCLLEQGFICMGPLTRDGCGALCPNELGVPCSGCRGPDDIVLSSQSRDLRLETIRRLARATGKSPGEVEEWAKDPAHSFFKYCLAEPLFRHRRIGGTSPFIHRLSEEGEL